jgi:hypothetical protein
VDTKKLPLSMLVALGLAPGGCEELGCVTRPCLEIAEPRPPEPQDDTKGPPSDSKGPPPEGKDDAGMQPCLMVVAPDPSGVSACLDVPPCLSPPMPPDEDPKAGPCLDVDACLSPRPDRDTARLPKREGGGGGKASAGGMARADVLERLLNSDVLPRDIATRLRGKSDDA